MSVIWERGMSVFAVTREGSELGWDATRRKRNYRI